LSSFITLLVSS